MTTGIDRTDQEPTERDQVTGQDGVGRRRARSEGHRRGWRVAALSLGSVVAVAGVVTSLTPWPSAMLIRSVFERGGAATVAEMRPHVPTTPLSVRTGVAYGTGGADTTLDVFTAAAPGERRPTVIWVHGGAWISGSSADVDPYLRILAARGYTTVGLNYTRGPEAAYPTAITQLNDALAHVVAHADELNVDPERIVLAGDSAGAQLASQLAALVTNSDYADLLGIRPALQPAQLAGVVLNCGVYDLRAMADLNGLMAWGFKTSLWAYTGTRDWSAEYSGATMSTINFVTKDFPPTFITGGNGDGLTWLQSIPMAQRLKELGVEVTTLFWPAQHEPALPHEYQFHLDRPEAQDALRQTEAFLERALGR